MAIFHKKYWLMEVFYGLFATVQLLVPGLRRNMLVLLDGNAAVPVLNVFVFQEEVAEKEVSQ